mmetsp:Transcript_148464/g.262106  ORF Transcript_148464/g.262106 Transcript_148464/m.262106 type:complete len:620 (+) Transcript_148464:25-1884(+)
MAEGHRQDYLLHRHKPGSEDDSNYAQKVFLNIWVRMFVRALIVVNIIQIGLAAEISSSSVSDIWKACDYLFTIVFAIEMVLGIVAFRHHYFCNFWYLLDFTVAMVAMVDIFILSAMDISNKGIAAFRAIRSLRLLWVAKLLHAVPDLMVIVRALLNSIREMFWIFVLMLIFVYVAAMLSQQIVGIAATGYSYHSEEALEDDFVVEFNNYIYFESILRSMTTLFNMVILAEWPEIMWPTTEHQPVMLLFFVLVNFLLSLDPLNVILGVVHENTTKAMQENQDREESLKQAKHLQMASSFADSMIKLDVDGDRRIILDELEQAENITEVSEVLGSLNFPVGYSVKDCEDISPHVLQNGTLSLRVGALVPVFSFLHAAELRYFGGCSSCILQVLENTPAEWRRACELLKWYARGGGAHILERDAAVAIGGGDHPQNGVAVAKLAVSAEGDIAFRFVLEVGNTRGDLLIGMTRHDPGRDPRRDLETLSETFCIGSEYIMGRGHAPASILYGGRGLRCSFSRGDGRGTRVDYGPSGGVHKEGFLARLRDAGDWVEFHVANGIVAATDFQGNVFEWGEHISAEEIWHPTIAWTGSTVSVRILRGQLNREGRQQMLHQRSCPRSDS